MPGIDSYTKLCLHMNSDWTDSSESPHTVTPTAGSTIDTVVKYFGDGSGHFAGGGGDVASAATSADWDFGTGDFTIDGWLYLPAAVLDTRGILTTIGTGNGYSLQINAEHMRLYSNARGSYDADLVSSGHMAVTTWFHFALVRYGGVLTLYIDGASAATRADVATWDYDISSNVLMLGRVYTNIVDYGMHCNIDELRVSKGIARWTEPFTPPTAEYAGAITRYLALTESFSARASRAIFLPASYDLHGNQRSLSLPQEYNARAPRSLELPAKYDAQVYTRSLSLAQEYIARTSRELKLPVLFDQHGNMRQLAFPVVYSERAGRMIELSAQFSAARTTVNPTPFPPNPDCPTYVSPLESFVLPMLPKPLWTGATSYDDPNYPSGGGPEDVPAAPPSMGQALPSSNISPPTQTSMGGGGDTIEIPIVQVEGSTEGGGYVATRQIRLLPDHGASPNFEQDPDTVALYAVYLIR